MGSIQWHKVFDDWEEAKRAIPENTMRKATVLGLSICIVHTEGQFFVVDDLCPHLRASLSQGKINAFGEIICPLHHYRFSLQDGRESENRCKDLAIHKIEERDGAIFIGLMRL